MRWLNYSIIDHWSYILQYSGGAEAYDGQGGFCGSAGSAKLDPKKIKVHHEALMHIEDLQRLSRDMEEFRYLSNLARKSIGRESFQANVRARNLVTDSAFVRALERLEFKSQPVWGLSINERKMVKDARNASNEAQDASIIH